MLFRTYGPAGHLKRLSGREARHRRNVNHVISKKLVVKAKDTGRAIVLEKLKGIRDQTTVRKAQRRRHNSWGFGQMRNFIEYKARLAGTQVVAVNPRGTSHICPRCGLEAKQNRPTRDRFECVGYGFAGPADYIAALNIAARGAVSRPIVPRNFLEHQAHLRTSQRFQSLVADSAADIVYSRALPSRICFQEPV